MNKKNLELITKLRHELHKHPELSCQETWTKAHLMEFLKEHTKLEIKDMGAWFYAVYRCGKEGAKVLGFRADFDALPIGETCQVSYVSETAGQGHKCGHDGHSSMLVGLALELDQSGADCDVILIFQHGEEIGAGGLECSQVIEKEHVEQVYAFHNLTGYPEGSVDLYYGACQPASVGFTILFEGKTSHASQPQNGKNPAVAIAEIILYMNELLKEEHKGIVLATLVHTEIGTKNFGISAGRGEVSMTLRAFYGEEMDELQKKLCERAEELAEREGLTVRFEETDRFPDTVNDEKCLDLVKSCAEKLGKQVVVMSDPFYASEDFGYYLKKCPGAMIYLGNGEAYAALHTTEYDFNDHLLEAGVDLDLEIIREASKAPSVR